VTQSASQAAAFRREAVAGSEFWTIEDQAGIPAPEGANGRRAMPFWSSRPRAVRVTETVEAFKGFTPRLVPLAEFEDRWLPGLERDGLFVGVNWTGSRATGYDVAPADVADWLRREREQSG
jgi:hypothetical protein